MGDKNKKPEWMFCRICGSKLDRKSLLAHESSCWAAWTRQNAPDQSSAVGAGVKLKQRPPSLENVSKCEHCGNYSAGVKDVSTALLRSTTEDTKGIVKLGHTSQANKKTSEAQNIDAQKSKALVPIPAAKSQAVEKRVEKSMFQEDRIKCDKCGQRILPDRMAAHRLQCGRTGAVKQKPEVVHRPARKTIPGGFSRFKFCFLCGRPFGSASIGIHEPKCLEKWRQTNQMLPPRMRKPEPTLPNRERQQSVVVGGSGGGGRAFGQGGTTEFDLDPENEAAWQQHLQQLIPCMYCSRTFFPDRVMVHQNVCIERKKGHRRRSTGIQTCSIDRKR